MVKIAMPQMGTDLFRIYMKSKYVQSVERAGGTVCWIDVEDPTRAAEDALKCDGLLLPGGADVDPALYGQKPGEKCGKPNEQRDRAEGAMAQAFLRSGKPIFGICRGIQFLNVALGGTLLQDIRPVQKERHMDFLHRASSTHSVTIEPSSELYRILGKPEIRVNSMHHQAVDRLGDGLVVTARSSDGFVEAVERKEGGFCLAVQWHPEHMSRRSEDQRKLFTAFVDACGKRAAQG